jgi:hypothetical protein
MGLYLSRYLRGDSLKRIGKFRRHSSPLALTRRKAPGHSPLSFAFNKQGLTLWRYSVTKILEVTLWQLPQNVPLVYFDPAKHKALKLKSIETSKSISDLVNMAVKGALAEDAEDISAYEERANQPLISFSEMVKRLKKDDRI